ncbi:hypothetical protein [Actinokineospora iranica]|nr:hypothetical protein [Actinokineospora iranica]
MNPLNLPDQDFDKPIADVVEQRRFARVRDEVDDAEQTQDLEEATVGEADPADVADQHRPVPERPEPWP